MGFILRKRGDLDGAAAHYQKAAEVNPQDDTALSNLCYVYGLKKEYRRAMNLCNAALAIDSENGYALNNRALAYLGMGNDGLALDDLNRSLEALPDYAPAYLNRGEVFRRKRDEGRALADFQKALAFTDDAELLSRVEAALGKAGGAAAEEAVRQIDSRRDDAIQRGDADEVRRLTAADFIGSENNEIVFDNLFQSEDYLNLLKKQGQVLRFDPLRSTFTAYGQSAVIAGRATVTVNSVLSENETVTSPCLLKRVYGLRNGNWVLVAEKITVLAR
jgi:tetratricopeptide (TPR) repeat protein